MITINEDLLDPQVVNDPHSYYRELRENSPVYFNKRWKGWIVTDFDSVYEALHSPKISAERLNEDSFNKMTKDGQEVAKVMRDWMVLKDPPEHTRIRKVLQKAFNPKIVMGMRKTAVEIVHLAIDKVEHRGEMDLVSDYAFSIPSYLLSAMMGIPQKDFDKIKEWTNNLNKLVFIDLSEPDRHKKAYEGVRDMSNYLREVFEERKQNPGNDLISALIEANEDGILSEDELIAQAVLLFQAGHESTTALITNGVLTLLKHPDQLKKLREDPSLINSAVEEILRYDGTSKATIRLAKEDIVLGGQLIKKGERLLLVFHAANRDPKHFDNPEVFDITRGSNNHLGFGHGAHYCLGNQLARLEGTVAIGAIIERLPNLKVGTDQVDWAPLLVARVMNSLRVTF